MRLLLDTHLLLWSETEPRRISAQAKHFIQDVQNQLVFSVVSIWEVAVKFRLGRSSFTVEPAVLRTTLLADGYEELLITSAHAIGVASLPLIHRDPFDRLLVAQAAAEGIILLTNDSLVAQYPGPIRLV